MLIVIDELTALTTVPFANVDRALARLAQRLRAVGVHVVATRGPSAPLEPELSRFAKARHL